MQKFWAIVFCAAFAAVCFWSSTASAVLNIYEPFNYSTGSLQGNTNASAGTTANGNIWQRAGVSNPPAGINVTTGSLTGPVEMPPSIGNDLSITHVIGGDGSMNRLALDQNYTTGTVYYSFLLNVPSLTNATTGAGAFFMSMNNSADISQATNPTTVPGKIQIRIDGTDSSKYNLGIFGQAGAVAVSTGWATNQLDTNTTQFIVASLNPNTKLTRLWLNPDPATFGLSTAPTATASLTDATTWSGNNIQSILLRQIGTLPDLTLDELRVGDSWGVVTPTLSAYWDINGTTAGAGGTTPSGTWDGVATNWSASAAGDVATTTFPGAGYKAVFSAGTDATGAYTVTVNGTQSAAALSFENEGIVSPNVGPQPMLDGGTVNVTTGVISADTTVAATIRSEITGSSGINKIGGGTVILSGNLNYTGATTISGGTLQIGEGGTAGALPTSSAITNNGTLVFSRSNAVTQGTDFSGADITGTGSLTQAGTGTTTLNTANTFSGTTRATNGALVLTDGAALQNSTLDMNAADIAGSVTYDNAVTSITLGSLSGTRDFSYNSAASIALGTNSGTYAGALSGSGSLTKAGVGTQNLAGTNTYSGGTTINGGVLQFNQTISMPTTGAVSVDSGGILSVRSNGSGEWSGDDDELTAGTIGSLIKGTGGQAGTEDQITWIGGSVLGIDTTNASGGSLTYDGVIGSFRTTGGSFTDAVGFHKRGTGTLKLTGNNTFSGPLSTANMLATDTPTNTLVLAGSNDNIATTIAIGNNSTLVLGTDTNTGKTLNNALPSGRIINLGTAGRFQLYEADETEASTYSLSIRGISGGGGVIAVGYGTLTIDTPDTETYTMGGLFATSYNQGNDTHGTIIKDGPGTLNLTQQDNAQTGEFILREGTLGIGHQHALGQAGANTIFTIESGTVTSISGGTLALHRLNIAGSFTLNNGAGNIQFSGPTGDTTDTLTTLAVDNPTMTVNPGTGGVMILLRKITDDGTSNGFTKAGTGVLTLGSKDNDYGGDTIVQEGTLRVNTSIVTGSEEVASLGRQTNPGRLVMAGGSVSMNGQIGSVWAPEHVGNPYNGTRTNVESNPIHVEAPNDNSRIMYESTTAGVVDDVNFVFTTDQVDWTSGALTFSHAATSTGAKFNAIFSGSGFDYAGPVVISNGAGAGRNTVLRSTNTSGVQTWSGNMTASLGAGLGSAIYQRDAGGTTALGGATVSVNITNNGAIVFNRETAATFSGNMSGSGTMNKQGAGTLFVNGANTHLGVTTVEEGTLGGTGSISGSVVVEADAGIAPGASAGVLSVGSVTFDADSFFDIEIGGNVFTPPTQVDYDRLAVTGAATLGGSINLSLINGFTPATNEVFRILTAGSRTGVFVNTDTTNWDVSYGNDAGVEFVEVTYLGVADFAGDYNDDGAVDAADYVMWRHTEADPTFELQNDTATPGSQAGDYDTWTANFGNEEGGGSGQDGRGAVPEPATFALVLLGLICAAASRRRHA